MEIRLTSNPNQRGLILQPASVNSDYFIIHEYAPSSGGQTGRLQLVR